MVQPNIPCPLVANGYIPTDTPDIPVIPPPAGGGDTDPGSPIIIVRRTNPHDPGTPVIIDEGGGTGNGGGGTPIGGGVLIPGGSTTGTPVIIGGGGGGTGGGIITGSNQVPGSTQAPGINQVPDFVNTESTTYIDTIRLNIATQNVPNNVEIVDSTYEHTLLNNRRDQTIDELVREVMIKKSYTFDHINRMTYNKVKVSLKPEILDVISNLHVEGSKVDENTILNNVLNKIYQNELHEITMSDINSLKGFTVQESVKPSIKVKIPDKVGYTKSSKSVSKSRNVDPIVVPNNTSQLVNLETAVQYTVLNKRSLTPGDYNNIYVRDLMKFWYKVNEDDALTTTPYVLDLKDEIKIINSLGESPNYTLEFTGLPSLNLETNYEFNDLDTHYILSLNEEGMEDLDTDNFLLRKTRVRYDIVTGIEVFEEDFKHKVFPYLVTYVHYNDPILAWIQDGRIDIRLTMPSVTLRNFGDYTLVRRIPTHIILIPTNKFNLIPRGGKSETTTWGSRVLTLYHSIDDTRRSNSQILTSPIFEFKQTWPGINIDTITTTRTVFGIPVTLRSGVQTAIPITGEQISFIDSNAITGNIPVPGNNLYVVVGGIGYSIPASYVTNLIILSNLYPYSLEASIHSDPPIASDNYVPTVDDPTGNTVPTRKLSPVRYYVRVINYLKNNYDYDSGLTYYDVYSRMENSYRYGLNFEMGKPVRDYIAKGQPTGINIYGSTTSKPVRVIRFNGTAELFPVLSPEEGTKIPL